MPVDASKLVAGTRLTAWSSTLLGGRLRGATGDNNESYQCADTWVDDEVRYPGTIDQEHPPGEEMFWHPATLR